MTYFQVQNIAKQTIEYLNTQIEVGINLKQLRKLAEDKMLLLGADSFWYWDIGAFIFAGEDTTMSVSGKSYQTSERKIAKDDIITIDLSPQTNNIWGDYARTIIVENGNVVKSLQEVKNDEWRNGLLTEKRLHRELVSFATPNTTFEQLYYHINDIIEKLGYKNLDFMGNLGHSIAKRKQDRIYIEKGNSRKLGDVEFFTFEPHISKYGSKYGYKREDIYFFDNEKLREL